MKRITTILVLFVFAYSALADSSYKDSSATRFSHLSVEHGLSHHEVLFVMQDSQGFMWFGTKHGLNKYDGNKITSFIHDLEKPSSISGNFAHWIHEDQEGSLWISTWGDGVSRYDPKTGNFTNYRHEENNPQSLGSNNVWSLFVDSKGIVWAATDGGLTKLDPKTGSIIRYRHEPGNPNSLTNNTVSRIGEDQQGILWVATYGGGLNRFNPKTEVFTNYQHNPGDPQSLSNNNLWAVYIDTQQRIWVASERGLNRFNPALETFTVYQHDESNPDSLSSDTVTFIYEDHAGILLLGTFGGGLNRFDPQRESFTRYRYNPLDPHSLSSDVIMSICEDTTGSLWIGTYGGVDKLDPEEFQFGLYGNNIHSPNDLSNANVRSIFQDRDGTIWIGTTGGLNRLNKSRDRFQSYLHSGDPSSISDNDIWSIDQDRRGDLWIGTHGGGLNRFDSKQKKFARYVHDPNNPNSPSGNSIYDLVVDKKRDVLWIASYLSGLDKFHISKGKFTHYRYNPDDPDGIVSNWAVAVFVDSKGFVWIGTESGLSRFNPETERFNNFKHDPFDSGSLSDNLVQAIYEDNKNNIWIGTGNGLNRYEESTRSFKHYRVGTSLLGNRISAITGDKDGNLWVSSNSGITKFNPENETFRHYDQRDGLQGDIFLMHSVFRNEDNELFFGGTNGFNIFNPDSLTENPNLPKVVLTGFKLFNQAVTVGEDSPLKQHINQVREIFLEYLQTSFSIEFAALNYRNSRKNRYAYRMVGFDKGYTYVGSDRRVATYTNLDPGKYTFHVKGSNNDGRWNEKGASVDIIINPPWWKTGWFYALVSMGTVLFIMLVFYYVIKLRSEIAERILAEKDLKQSERKFRTLVDSAPYGIQLTDLEGKIIYSNPAHHKIQGYAPEELIGKYIWDLIASDADKKTTEEYYKSLVQQQAPPVAYEAIDQTKDGRFINTEISWEHIRNDMGALEAIISIIHDVTEQKQNGERLKSSLKEKETLLQEIHHRVKNNMQIISSLLSLQADTIEDKPVEEVLKESQGRVHAMAVVHETLHDSDTLSEIDLQIYLPKLTTAVFQTYSVEPGKVSLVNEVDETLISIDQASPLGLIINELISNSLKYAFPDDRSGEIIVSTKKINDELELIVSDNGVGMPENLDWRNLNSLGLKLVRSLAEDQLLGSVEMESSHGTKFTIKFNIEA
jgi:PAS domain S-box-containing protein